MILLLTTRSGASQESRKLIVVVWEQRVPKLAHHANYGALLAANRGALLDVLYGRPGGLVGERPEDVVLAVYPEGLPAESAAPQLYTSIKRSPPEEIAERYLSEMVVLPGTSGRVKGLHYSAAPSRAELDRELKQSITFPLIGLDNADLAFEETQFETTPDPALTRGVSMPRW